MIKFSIIIPCYNAEDYITDCLDSLLSQRHDSLVEIIVVNDNSSDSTRNILERYSSSGNIILINNKKNEGQFLSRNKGIKAASGDYILFVDADDYVSKEYLTTLENKLLKYNRPDLLLFSRINFSQNKHGNKIKKHKNKISNKDSFLCGNKINAIRKKFLTSDKYNSVVTKLISKDLLLKDNETYNDLNVSNAEDRIKSYCIFDHVKNVVISNDCLYYYRYNPKSFTKQHRNLDEILHYFNSSVFYLDNLYINKWNLSKSRKKVVKKALLILPKAFKIYALRNYEQSEIINAFVSINWKTIYPEEYLSFLSKNYFFRRSLIKAFFDGNTKKLMSFYKKIKLLQLIRHPSILKLFH